VVIAGGWKSGHCGRLSPRSKLTALQRDLLVREIAANIIALLGRAEIKDLVDLRDSTQTNPCRRDAAYLA